VSSPGPSATSERRGDGPARSPARGVALLFRRGERGGPAGASPARGRSVARAAFKSLPLPARAVEQVVLEQRRLTAGPLRLDRLVGVDENGASEAHGGMRVVGGA